MCKKLMINGCQILAAMVLSCFMSRVTCWEVWNSSCYSFSTTKKNYSDSAAACEEMNGHLVEIETEEEHGELRDHMDWNEDYWTGAQLNRTDNKLHPLSDPRTTLIADWTLKTIQFSLIILSNQPRAACAGKRVISLNLPRVSQVYVCCKRTHPEAEFYWSVGGGEVLGSLWASHAPNDNVECARLRTYNFENVLDDWTCSVEYRYICEKYEGKDMLYSCIDSQKYNKIDNQRFIAHQSSPYGMPAKAIDGNNSIDSPNCAITEVGDMAWWQVDLNGHFGISSVNITTSQDYYDACLQNLEIQVHSINPMHYDVNSNYNVYSTCVGPASVTEPSIAIECDTLVAGRYIRIVNTSYSSSADSRLTLGEVDVYGYECTQQQEKDTCKIPVISYNFSPTEQYTTTPDSGQAGNQTLQYLYNFSSTERYTTTPDSGQDGNQTSPCLCPCNQTKNANMSDDEIQEIIKQIMNELRISQKLTSAYRRSLTSADDKRLSAKGIGSVGIAILCIIILLIVANDMIRLGKFTYKKYLSWKKATPRQTVRKISKLPRTKMKASKRVSSSYV